MLWLVCCHWSTEVVPIGRGGPHSSPAVLAPLHLVGVVSFSLCHGVTTCVTISRGCVQTLVGVVNRGKILWSMSKLYHDADVMFHNLCSCTLVPLLRDHPYLRQKTVLKRRGFVIKVHLYSKYDFLHDKCALSQKRWSSNGGVSQKRDYCN